MAKSKAELLEYREELLKQDKILSAKLTRNQNLIRSIDKREDQNFINKIPKDINKITKKQWEWILYHYHDETELHYKFATELLQKKFKMNTSCFVEGVNQFKFSLHEGTEKNFFKGFNFLKKYLKETTTKHLRNSKQIIKGIPFTVFGVDDDHAPEAYYCKKNRHVYLISRSWSSFLINEFKSLKAFEDWYKQRASSVQSLKVFEEKRRMMK